jgi:hypothetical protein
MSAQGQNCAKRADKKTSNEVMCSKLSAIIATATSNKKNEVKKICWILNEILSEKGLLSVANEVHTVELERKTSLTKAEEKATGACRCQRVSVQSYSVQYKRYNLVRVTTVKGGATRGTTALVY